MVGSVRTDSGDSPEPGAERTAGRPAVTEYHIILSGWSTNGRPTDGTPSTRKHTFGALKDQRTDEKRARSGKTPKSATDRSAPPRKYNGRSRSQCADDHTKGHRHRRHPVRGARNKRTQLRPPMSYQDIIPRLLERPKGFPDAHPLPHRALSFTSTRFFFPLGWCARCSRLGRLSHGRLYLPPKELSQPTDAIRFAPPPRFSSPVPEPEIKEKERRLLEETSLGGTFPQATAEENL